MNNVIAFVIFGLLALAAINLLYQLFNKSVQYLKEAEYSPSMNTNSWDQHQRRLNKYGVSKYRNKYFHVDSKGGVFYVTSRGAKVYC